MNFVSAMDSIVDSINETVRKYCVDDSKTSPGRRAPATTASLLSTSPLSDYRLSDYSAGVASSAADSRSLCPSDVFASPHSSAALNHSFALSNSAGKTSASTNNNAAEVSFAMLARQTLKTPESANHRPAVFSSKPESVDVGVQVSPMDFSCDDVSENNSRTDVGIQAGGDELPANGDRSSFDGRCCPYCHSELLSVGDKAPMKDAETEPPSFVVASPVVTEDGGIHSLSSPLESVSASSLASTVTIPASLPLFVQCSLSLGDSFHYSPMRNLSSVATAPISIYPSNDDVSGCNHNEVEEPLPVSPCRLPISISMADNGLGLPEAGQTGSPMHADGFMTHPNTLAAEPSVINTPVVTFSITPEAVRLHPTPADSGGQLSNTSLSNITLSDLLPSVQGSIPLELLVNQTDGFTMYTEIVPISEPCQVDPVASLDQPAPQSSCDEADVSPEVAVSQESWSPTQLVPPQSPVNMMVCLPISSVSSPSLSSFLSQHKSLSSFASDSAIPRLPSPSTLLPPDDAIETVAITVVPPAEDQLQVNPAENYSIHRILDTSALKHVAGAADCSWSSSNTGVLISRRDIPTNSALVFDSSIAKEDNCAELPGANDTYHSNFCADSRGDDSGDTHDDVCVIDSDRDVIVIDGDDEVLRPSVAGSDLAAAVPERTSRVGRHGRRRRRQTTKSSADISGGRLSRHPMTRSVTVELDNSRDHSTSANCLDNGFVELSPSDGEQTQQPAGADVLVS